MRSMVAGKGRWRGGCQGQASGWTATACSRAVASCTGLPAARLIQQTLCLQTPSTCPGQQADISATSWPMQLALVQTSTVLIIFCEAKC